MNWYEGNIAEAVAKSKAKNAIFVVYVEGNDDSTQKLSSFINEQKIREMLESDDFVAIKIESDSQAYMQFATIYQVVPVPSIFFIGKSGTPLEIGTGIIASADELEEKIIKVLVAFGRRLSAVTSSSSFIAAEQQSEASSAILAGTSLAAAKTYTECATKAEPSTSKPVTDKISTANMKNVEQEEKQDEIICDGDICFKKPKEDVAEKVADKENTISINQTEQGEADAKLRLEEARKKMEEQRRQRIEEEKQLEKQRELQRRQEGKDIQNLQQWQREHELKELKENIRREKLEEQTARERIRAQIAADRAERAQKFSVGGDIAAAASNASTINTDTATISGGGATNASDNTRLQFRFANGNSATKIFNCQETLSKVRDYVRTELLPGTGIKHFMLAVTYPKRELTANHDGETLTELGLFPSAVILIIENEGGNSPTNFIVRSGGVMNIVTTLMMTILSPVFAIFGYFRNMVSGANKRRTENEEPGLQNDAAKRRNMERFGGAATTNTGTGSSPSTSADVAADNSETKPYRRYRGSNIHRLTDNRKDSDDENATWNGNSTQQQ